ncbi:hypothetical protein IEO21_05209 [Rhodonia placenta]|uniref:F-box domain-containing protein n=1 Tax=Rhodonia placenta TaxID=104341 RepID=A0A8H7P2E8_9APHY|nr:hypothetical protein IEO21_05209 [Postia placenta]
MVEATLISIPLELVENILVYCVADGSSSSIASLASTCRALRVVIYNASDHHLWRRIFLTTFDDPRKLSSVKPDDFDWRAEFTRRVQAKLFLQRHTQPLRVQRVYHLRSRVAMSLVDLTPAYDDASSARALRSILSVVSSAEPCDSHIKHTQDSDGVTTLSAQPLARAHAASPMYPPQIKDQDMSLNIPWLKTVLSRGLPPPLVSKIAGEHRDPAWDKSAEAQALGALLCCTGFLPVREVHEERTGRLSSGSASSTRQDTSNMSGLQMDIQEQQRRALHCARELVYNMAYLTRRQHWGPFVPADPAAAEAVRTEVSTNPAPRYLRRWVRTHFEMDSDSEDVDYVPPGDDGRSLSSASSASSISPPTPKHEPEPETQEVVPARRRRRVLPGAHELLPDWAWLAAARIVSEANLREQGVTEGLDEFIDWNSLRQGAWLTTVQLKSDSTEVSVESEKKPIEGSVQGWDWAGAEGVWRRCVSWLDYADLVHHRYTGISTPRLRSACLSCRRPSASSAMTRPQYLHIQTALLSELKERWVVPAGRVHPMVRMKTYDGSTAQ